MLSGDFMIGHMPTGLLSRIHSAFTVGCALSGRGKTDRELLLQSEAPKNKQKS